MDCVNSDLKKLIARSEILDVLIEQLAKTYESVYDASVHYDASYTDPKKYKSEIIAAKEECNPEKINKLQYLFDDINSLIHTSLPKTRIRRIRESQKNLEEWVDKKEKYFTQREVELLNATMEFTKFKNETSQELIKFFNGKTKSI